MSRPDGLGCVAGTLCVGGPVSTHERRRKLAKKKEIMASMKLSFTFILLSGKLACSAIKHRMNHKDLGSCSAKLGGLVP